MRANFKCRADILVFNKLALEDAINRGEDLATVGGLAAQGLETVCDADGPALKELFTLIQNQVSVISTWFYEVHNTEQGVV